MKAKAIKPGKMVKISDSELLSLVALKLKDRVLFPHKIEAAKKYLRNAKFISS